MDDYALKMLAMEIAYLLPENQADALKALDLAMDIVEKWLCKPSDWVRDAKIIQNP